MRICEVRLYNFRSYRDASVRLGPGLNVVVGPNNAGKSNLLAALNLLLGERHPRRDDIAYRDFHLPPGHDQPADLLGVAARLVGKRAGIRPDSDWGAYVEQWFPDLKTGEVDPWNEEWWRALAEPLTSSRRWLEADKLADYLGSAAERGELWLYLVCERDEEGEFSYGLLVRQEGADRWERVTRLRASVRDGLVTAAYLPAFRSPNESLRITEWSWYGKLVRDLYRSQRAERSDEFTQAEAKLSGLVQEAFTDPSRDLEELLQQLVPDVRVRFKAGPFTADDAHKTVTLFLDDGVDSPHSEKGAGLQSLLVVALFRLYCKRFHQCGSVLLIEEPENHLHPHGRRALVWALTEFVSGDPENRQVIITTHSENLVQVAGMDGLKVARRTQDGSRFWELPSDHSDAPRWQQIIRRCPEVVFADHAILVEGGEVYLLPALASRLVGEGGERILDRWNISVVRVEGKEDFKKHISLLEALGIGWTVLTDLDFLESGIEQFGDRLPSSCEEQSSEELKDWYLRELRRIGVFVNPWGTLEDVYTEEAQELRRSLRSKDRTALRIAEELENGSPVERWFRDVEVFREVIEHAVDAVKQRWNG